MSNGHSKIAPSSAERWISCPGSIDLSEKVPAKPDSEYAGEGTVAHDIGSRCLINNTNAKDYIGEVVRVKDTDMSFTVTEEMAEAVQEYVDFCRLFLKGKDHVHGVEQQFDMSWIHPGLYGTSDFWVFEPRAEVLRVVDYKHGVGIAVDAEWNTQLLIYALGAIKALYDTKKVIAEKIQHVELIIVQPRAYHSDGSIRRWTISANDLKFWALHVLRPAAKATDEKNAPLNVGKHCKFCPAIAVCPEQIHNACAVAKTDFRELVLPDPDQLTPEDIARVMRAADVISAWAKEVFVYAQSQMELGVMIPGHKLVAKRANRKWIDEASAAGELEIVLGEKAYEKKLLSVAKAEKVLEKNGFSPEATLQGLWDKESSGVTIAPESDKRKAVAATAVMEFIETADFMQ